MSGKVLTFTRTAFAALLFSAALPAQPALAAPAPGAPGSPQEQRMAPGNGQNPDFRQMLRERIQTRMDTLAARLELKASQQAVWREFVHAVLKVADIRVKQPGPNATAAQVAHYRAKRARKLANVLEHIARKTDRVEAILTPDQRAIFDKAFSHYRGMHHGGMHGHGMQPGGMRGNPSMQR